MVERLGGEADIPLKQGSIYARFKGNDGKAFYPLHLWADNASVSFSLQYLYKRSGMAEGSVRSQLLMELVEIVGPLTTSNLKGFPSFKVDILADPIIASKTERWLTNALGRMR